MSSMSRPLRRGLLLVLATVALTAAPALAHVEVGDSSVAPDGTASITFSFHHGCDGQPTTSLRIQLPEGVTEVEPQPVDGWQSSVTSTEISWTGGSIPDGDEGNFTAAMRVSGAAGTTIWFPTVQGCPSAEEAWIETSAPDEPEPENVAPSIVLATTIEPASASSSTAPPNAESSNTESSNTTRTTLVPGEAAVTEEGSPQNNAGLVVLLVVAAIIVGGAVVLFLRYRGRGNTKLPE
jgi:uncharacterized protein YcnI